MSWQNIKEGVIQRFLQRSAGVGLDVEVYENPTEEIQDGARAGKNVRMYGRGISSRNAIMNLIGKTSGLVRRLEDNYLYDTRRFPSAADNVIGAGAIVSSDYRFFQSASGTNGANNGFPTAFVMSDLETNMETPGQIVQGRAWVFRQIGLSFNSEAASGNIEQVLDAGALRFEKQGGQYTLRHGPARLWPGGTGVSGYAATTVAATTVESAHNGAADPRAVRSLRTPRVIKAKESFAYTYAVPRATRSIDATAFALTQFVLMTVWLWGYQLDAIPS